MFRFNEDCPPLAEVLLHFCSLAIEIQEIPLQVEQKGVWPQLVRFTGGRIQESFPSKQKLKGGWLPPADKEHLTLRDVDQK